MGRGPHRPHRGLLEYSRPADATATPADASPESADSPNESVTDSPEDTPGADDTPGDG